MVNIKKELGKYFTDVYVEPNYEKESWIIEVEYFGYLAEVELPAGPIDCKELAGKMRKLVDERERSERSAAVVVPFVCNGDQLCFEF